MVAFCEQCGVSLPGADTVIRSGKEYATPQTICPHCGKPACSSLSEDSASAPDDIFQDDQDILIKEGKILHEPKDPQV